MTILPPHSHFLLAPGRSFRAGLIFCAALVLLTGPVHAGNLLLNSDFSANNGNKVPTSWTYFEAANVPSYVHDYWIVDTNSVGCSHMAPESGNYFWKEWFISNGTNNVAGLSQTFSCSPGAIYQASGWLASSSCDVLGPDCATWIQVEFLNAGGTPVAIYKSDNFTLNSGLDTWIQFPVTNACDLTQPVSVGDPYFTTYAVTGTVSQLVAPFGTASVRYRFCYLTFLGEGGSAFFDAPVLNQVSGPAAPVISSLFPQDTMIFVNPTNGISFTATSPSGFTINNSGIQMTLNGTDVSGNLSITGSGSSKSVAYHGLLSNATYTASIHVNDVSNLTVNATITFQTMWQGVLAPTYLWEAEDWDFTNGMYLDFPDLCNAPGDPNCYFGKVGSPGVDELNNSGKYGPYRPDDPMGTAAAGDALRPNLYAAGRTDYRIDPFNGGEWVNYTRDWPNSTNWVIARISANVGDSGSLDLSLVNSDSTITSLGTFSVTGGQGYSSFLNVYLKDTNGNNAVVLLNGKQTLRLTSGGNVLPNFFMLVPAQADLPQISNLYPTGTRPFEFTNALSFTVTSPGGSFGATGIRVNLDGVDVSSNLVITGSASTKNVVLPNLLPNAIHKAVIACTNAAGHGVLLTDNFDTFSESNYMVECEDFDFNGGQFIDAADWFPDAYADYLGPYPAVSDIDFHHTVVSPSEVYAYRYVGIPQNNLLGHDYLRSAWSSSGSIDYILVFFTGGDWANYTRQYPAGSYYAYIRSSGDGPFSMYLDQVVQGQGTTNQITRRLGHFAGTGKDYNTFDWVPLTDDGLSAPALVTLGGTNTLRLTTAGNCNPNFFMFVAAGGIRIKAATSNGSTVLSFPTQAGVNYRVFYKTDLLGSDWTLLTTVLGTGSTVTVHDSQSGPSRFYKVTAP